MAFHQTNGEPTGFSNLRISPPQWCHHLSSSWVWTWQLSLQLQHHNQDNLERLLETRTCPPDPLVLAIHRPIYILPVFVKFEEIKPRKIKSQSSNVPSILVLRCPPLIRGIIHFAILSNSSANWSDDRIPGEWEGEEGAESGGVSKTLSCRDRRRSRSSPSFDSGIFNLVTEMICLSPPQEPVFVVNIMEILRIWFL